MLEYLPNEDRMVDIARPEIFKLLKKSQSVFKEPLNADMRDFLAEVYLTGMKRGAAFIMDADLYVDSEADENSQET